MYCDLATFPMFRSYGIAIVETIIVVIVKYFWVVYKVIISHGSAASNFLKVKYMRACLRMCVCVCVHQYVCLSKL